MYSNLPLFSFAIFALLAATGSLQAQPDLPSDHIPFETITFYFGDTVELEKTVNLIDDDGRWFGTQNFSFVKEDSTWDGPKQEMSFEENDDGQLVTIESESFKVDFVYVNADSVDAEFSSKNADGDWTRDSFYDHRLSFEAGPGISLSVLGGFEALFDVFGSAEITAFVTHYSQSERRLTKAMLPGDIQLELAYEEGFPSLRYGCPAGTKSITFEDTRPPSVFDWGSTHNLLVSGDEEDGGCGDSFQDSEVQVNVDSLGRAMSAWYMRLSGEYFSTAGQRIFLNEPDDFYNVATESAPPTNHPISEFVNAPNPFRNQTTFQLPSDLRGLATLELFDMRGRLVQSIPISDRAETTLSIQADRLPAGIYVARLYSREQIWHRKVVLAR